MIGKKKGVKMEEKRKSPCGNIASSSLTCLINRSWKVHLIGPWLCWSVCIITFSVAMVCAFHFGSTVGCPVCISVLNESFTNYRPEGHHRQLINVDLLAFRCAEWLTAECRERGEGCMLTHFHPRMLFCYFKKKRGWRMHVPYRFGVSSRGQWLCGVCCFIFGAIYAGSAN